MKENLAEILKREFDRGAGEIDDAVQNLETESPEVSNLEMSGHMRQEFLGKLRAYKKNTGGSMDSADGAGSTGNNGADRIHMDMDDGLLLARMSEEGREAYLLGKKLLEKRENGGEVMEISRKRARTVRFLKKRVSIAAGFAAVLALAMGLTSVGGRTYVMDGINTVKNGINNAVMNSEEKVRVKSEGKMQEVYAEINDTFGVEMVTMNYLPDGFELSELEINQPDKLALISLGDKKGKYIRWYIYTNYKDSSLGRYFDDELLEEDEEIVSEVSIKTEKYRNPENITYHYVEFSYNNVNYELIMDVSDRELKKILKNLFFSK